MHVWEKLWCVVSLIDACIGWLLYVPCRGSNAQPWHIGMTCSPTELPTRAINTSFFILYISPLKITDNKLSFSSKGQFQRTQSFSILSQLFWIVCVNFFLICKFAFFVHYFLPIFLPFFPPSSLPSFSLLFFVPWKLFLFDATKPKFVKKTKPKTPKKGDYPCLFPLCI